MIGSLFITIFLAQVVPAPLSLAPLALFQLALLTTLFA